jgi:hypothetical protein
VRAPRIGVMTVVESALEWLPEQTRVTQWAHGMGAED